MPFLRGYVERVQACLGLAAGNIIYVPGEDEADDELRGFANKPILMLPLV